MSSAQIDSPSQNQTYDSDEIMMITLSFDDSVKNLPIEYFDGVLFDPFAANKNPELCTECVGFHDEPQCAAVCPVDCCIPDPNHVEDKDSLLKKKESLDQLENR